MAIPEIGEYVVVTVRKIMPYGAFCTLDEYGDAEAFLHISEISSGWIRNVREHVKEDQKTVCKVIRLDQEKRQIDLSLKRVTEADKKRKLEAFQSEKRAQKLLERVALKLAKPIKIAQEEAAKPLIEEFGDLYAAFEAISQGTEPKKLPKAWLAAISEIAKKEIKPKIIQERVTLTFKCFAGDGATRVKDAFEKIKKLVPKEVKLETHYLGAPTYYLDFSSSEHKPIDKTIDKITELLEKSAKKEDFEYEVERAKK